MNYLEFFDLLKQDKQNASNDRRLELKLDYEFKVWYDSELDKYWYYTPQDDTFFEVIWVGHLAYKNDNYHTPYDGSCQQLKETEYWLKFVKSLCCGIEKNGRDILWFDKATKENDEL